MKCKNLDVWKRAAALSADIYLQLKSLKDYGFKDQLTRSGLSVPSNIAEGLERTSELEKVRFLDIARASIAEAKTQIYIGMKIEYIPRNIGNLWIKEYGELGRMLTSLMQSIQENVQKRTSK